MTELIKRLGGKNYLEKRARASMRWIKSSYAAHDFKGSAAYLSNIKGWSFAYPETSGYLLGTLDAYSSHFEDKKIQKLLDQQVDFLISTQLDNGAFPRFFHEEKAPLVFDTAQILLGLNQVFEIKKFKSEKVLNAIRKAYEWLLSKIDTIGRFESHNFVVDYNPSYYTRIIWPLYQSKIIINDTSNDQKLERCLDYFIGLQNENLSFKDWSFEPANPALTHSIAYTLRGVYEISKLLDRADLKSIVIKTLEKLAQEISDNSWQVAATYDQDWTGNYSFVCSAGNAQLLILYLQLFGIDHFDIKLYESLMGPLIKSQRKSKAQKSFGAVPSSIPIWGKYQRFRYTNWTQKFYLDALLALLKYNH